MSPFFNDKITIKKDILKKKSGVVLYWIYSSFGPVSFIAPGPPLNVGGDQTIEAEEVGLDADVSHLPAAWVWHSLG